MGRDVGRDKGREQSEWRDLVARLELQAPVDPAEAPWPDRENLRAKTPPGAVSSAGGSGPSDSDPSSRSGPTPEGEERPGDGGPGDAAHRDSDTDASHGGRGTADRSRVIRPAGTGEPARAGPRDYELDEPSDDDSDDRYIPPPLPPQPRLDPVAKGAWLALFGGPGYLLIATLLGWQIAGWAALTAVAAFVAGFVVLVFRLGDGPSKRDGPDQGAIV